MKISGIIKGMAFIGVAVIVAGCCGSMSVDRLSLQLPDLAKSMDRVHDEIVAKGDGQFYVGAAMVDITPAQAYTKKGIYIGGFDMGRRSTGVRDPVYAHALFMDDGKTPYVLVTIDTIGYMNDDIQEVRALTSDRWRDRIVIASTHDHVGPDTLGYWGPAFAGVIPICPGTCPNYMETLKYQIAKAIDMAAENARPANIKVGKGPVDPSLSLNIHNDFRDEKTDEVRVFVATALDGKTIAVLANWGCHAEAMWNDSEVSADFPGVFYKRVTEKYNAVPIFVERDLGGLVSIHPGEDKMAMEEEIKDVFLKHMTEEERVALKDKVGNGLTDAVFAVMDGAMQQFGPSEITIKTAQKKFEMKVENWIFNYMGNRKILHRDSMYADGAYWMTTDIIGARLYAGDKAVAEFITVPGEPSPPLVLELDAMSSAEIVFTVALGNDEVGYIVREADWGRYDYEPTMSLGRTTATVVTAKIGEVRAGL